MRATFLLAVLLTATQVIANDSAIKGVGGAIHLMDEHSSVRMVSEHVRIKLPSGEVETTFVFRNDGPATTVLMGFPESGYNVGSIKTGFEHFKSLVDGRRVKVERRVAEPSAEGAYKLWWVKKVAFGTGQSRTVVNRYRAKPGDSTDGTRSFTYIVETGASWNGRIGEATFECDISALHSASRLRLHPQGYQRKGKYLVWERKEFEPSRDDNIHISWFPGWLDISVNGRPVYTRLSLSGTEYDIGGWPFGDWGRVYSWREGDEVWASLRATASWLGAKLTVVEPNRTLRLTRGERWVEVTVGSRTAKSDRSATRLSGPAKMKQNHIVAPLTSVIRSLGGTATWNHKTGFLDITMPD